jgi:hypothetical protein
LAPLTLKTEELEPDAAITDQELPPLTVERTLSGPLHQSMVVTTAWLALEASTLIPE